MAKQLFTYNKSARGRISRSVHWTERNRTSAPLQRNRPQTAMQLQVGLVGNADIEHHAFGAVDVAEGSNLSSPLVSGPTTRSEIFNPGLKVWAGSRVLIQQSALSGAAPGSGGQFQIVNAFSATRIRGTASADIESGNTGTLTGIVPIDGAFPYATATVFLPTQNVAIKEGLMVWAELRFDGAQSVWEVYSADCDPGGGGGGTNELIPNDDGTVPWDIEVNGTVCTLELVTVSSGNPLELQIPAGILDRDQLYLTVKQDATGGHILYYDQTAYFWPYGEPQMDTSPNAIELMKFTAVETTSQTFIMGEMTPNLDAPRIQINPENGVNLSPTTAAVVATGKGPTITDGANALDGSDLTFCTLNKDTIVQNATQEWAVRIEFANQVAITELTAIGLAECSFTLGTRYPDLIQVYFFSDQFGAGNVVYGANIDPVAFWASGITTPAPAVYASLRPYDGPFQSVEFWFRFTGRNTDIGDVTFSRAFVISRLPGWTGT